MPSLTGFVAYPSAPTAIGTTIRSALELVHSEPQCPEFQTWEENDVAGRFIVEPVLTAIDDKDIFVADITRLNFNVVFEIGYAIGRRKRVHLIRNSAIIDSGDLIREIGLFDTLGYQNYSQSTELATYLRTSSAGPSHNLDDYQVSSASPVYIVLPRVKTDGEIRLLSRVKKARLQFRTFDPEEQGRLSAVEAIDNVARSHGVIVPLLARDRADHDVHNYRGAFVGGLALALERALLFLQEGDDPVPLDYRDLVSSVRFPDQIDQYVSDFATDIGARFQALAVPFVAEPRTFLERLTLGASAAENELQDLGFYYLETDEYRRALRGEVQVVTGRKGSGKTALFAQLRDRLREDKSYVVLDLKPEGFQLLKLRERVLDYLEEGTKEHTITAFWEYLLLLETCHKILEKDKAIHMRDHRLFQPYRRLVESYYEDEHATEGDFSERMLALMQRVADDFQATHPKQDYQLQLDTGEITELLHRHDVATLRDRVVEYLSFKSGLWILFDNLDKGWPPHGVSPEDVRTLRCLLEAMVKIQRALERRRIECRGIVFIRNDVYELLVANSPDRGKVASITLDWTDADLLRELLRKRFIYGGVTGNPSFEEMWRQVAISHIRGEETSQYLIDRCLMRPRALIELLRFCRSHAVNLGHLRIDATDIDQGEEAYSSELLNNINYELRDILPNAGDLLYDFIESREVLTGQEVREILVTRVGNDLWEDTLELLLWYGFLGLMREDGDATYIYAVKYDVKRLRALVQRRDTLNARYRINPAFWRALEVRH
jgi:hypothetical protein